MFVCVRARQGGERVIERGVRERIDRSTECARARLGAIKERERARAGQLGATREREHARALSP